MTLTLTTDVNCRLSNVAVNVLHRPVVGDGSRLGHHLFRSYVILVAMPAVLDVALKDCSRASIGIASKPSCAS